ncbi:MAG: hypothetical protein GY847_27500 [Proteobacteria bacterium]|nr:hypothetical protein [Pseudomonadota bacterium]
MKKTIFIIVLSLCLPLEANDQGKRKVLFVYDNLNKRNEPYIAALRDNLKAEGISCIDLDLREAKHKTVNLAEYDYVLIYSEVRAFNARIYLRKWLKHTEGFHLTKTAVFVTSSSNRYHCRVAAKISQIITSKQGQIIDAISSATNRISDEDKKKMTKSFSKRFIELMKLEK